MGRLVGRGKTLEKYKSLLKDTIVFAIGSVGSKLILFFLVPFYTNYLTREQYGTADLVAAFATLINPIVSMVICRAVIRFSMMNGERREDVAKTGFSFLLLTIVLTIAITPILGIYEPISRWRWYLCFTIILMAISETEELYLKAKGKNRTYAFISILKTLLLATLNIVLIKEQKMGVAGYLGANIAALFFVCIASFIPAQLHRDLRVGKFDLALLKRMLFFSAPIVINDIFWWILQSSDRIIIERSLGAAELGTYTTAVKMQALINVVNGVFYQAWSLSAIRESEGENDSLFYSRIHNIYNTLIIALCLIIVAAIKPFMKAFVGTEFTGAWVYTPLLLVASALYAMAIYYSCLYIAFKKTHGDMWTMVICAVVNLIICLLTIPRIGVWGAVISAVASEALFLLLRRLNMRKYIIIDVGGMKYYLSWGILFFEAVSVTMGFYVLPISFICMGAFLLLRHKEVRIALELAKDWIRFGI